MFKLPYDTTICAVHSVERLTLALKRANIEYPFPTVTTPAGNVIEQAVMITPREEHEDVPVLTQFLNLGDENNPKLVIDARAYMRYDHRNDTYRLTAVNDYSFLCNRLALTLVLMNQGSQVLGRLGDIPAKTFVRWISSTLARRYNLPLEQQLSLMILCAYYYYGLVDKQSTIDEEARTRLAPIVARVTGAQSATVLDMAAMIQQPAYNATAFAKQISELSGSLRFGDFKFIDLFSMLASSWIGIGARETVGVALEHIPTFIALVYSALGERSYRKTILTQRAESAGRLSDHKQFVSLVSRLISEQFSG